ncbi:MAG: fumarylacetoacetate hydrolase family protein [Pirellulales bacterium]|nr:fumarylacetoacetate hydrolase family protein [Pirellulales bacterium]
MSLAERLWNARIQGTRISMSSVKVPADEAAAYEIQDAVSQVADEEIIGFKLGATSDAALTALGLSEPFYGPLFERFSHRSDEVVALPSKHQIFIETEIAVGLGRDLPPRDSNYTQHDVEAAAAWIGPAFELVATRFDMELTGNGILLIADGGVNADFVMGDQLSNWSQLDLTQHPVTQIVNDRESQSGHSGMSIFGNPFGAVAWLANHKNLRDRGLKTGDIITTGTCTGMTPLEAGDHVHADLGRLEQLSMRLVAQ